MSDILKGITRQFAVGTVVSLYELDLSHLGGPVHYFTNNVFVERIPIVFGGNTYVQIAVSMSDVETDSRGSPSSPNFSIASSGGPIPALLQQYSDLRRAIIRRYTTFAEFLDVMPDGAGGVVPNPNADPSARIREELFVVNRKTSADDVFVELELKSPADLDGVQIPLRIVRKRWCDAKYRVPDGQGDFVYFPVEDGGCPYTGELCFDVNGEPTTPAADRCSKELTTGCVARFGKSAPLPYSAFPGVRGVQEV
jgi:lambda family phage minor tail protein L